MTADYIPKHVGIIMDGNGRWAKKRGLSRNFGHKQGAKVFGDIARHGVKIGIAYMTFYAFSTENWKRTQEEINGIMSLIKSYLKDLSKYKDDNMRMVILGDRTPLDQEICRLIDNAEKESANNTGMVLNIALNYGGRSELVMAAQTLAALVAEKAILPCDITEKMMQDCLYTKEAPDVDLIIRTSGEKRISNFLLWQSAYAEFVFTDILWPDFSAKNLDLAIEEYAARARRHGGV